MPETRYVYEYTDGVLSATTPYEVSDEQLAEEAALASTRALILDVLDDPWTAQQAIDRLKLLIRRLLQKGVIP